MQGEIDIIRRAEEDEARRKRQSGDGGKENAHARAGKAPLAVVGSDVDAMKPVDDVVVGLDADAETATAVSTIAALVPGSRHAHTGSDGGVPRLQAAPAHAHSGRP